MDRLLGLFRRRRKRAGARPPGEHSADGRIRRKVASPSLEPIPDTKDFDPEVILLETDEDDARTDIENLETEAAYMLQHSQKASLARAMTSFWDGTGEFTDQHLTSCLVTTFSRMKIFALQHYEKLYPEGILEDHTAAKPPLALLLIDRALEGTSECSGGVNLFGRLSHRVTAANCPHHMKQYFYTFMAFATTTPVFNSHPLDVSLFKDTACKYVVDAAFQPPNRFRNAVWCLCNLITLTLQLPGVESFIDDFIVVLQQIAVDRGGGEAIYKIVRAPATPSSGTLSSAGTFSTAGTLSTAGALHSPTTKLRDLTLGGLLGSGASGSVYRGLCSGSGETVAVKCVTMLNPSGRRQLSTEIAYMQQLTHPNIVRYYGATEDESTFYIVMELAAGGTLKDHVKEFQYIDEPTIAKYARQVLKGLAYLHAKHVVHRDIKCANILISDKGNIKLSDFGTATTLVGTPQVASSSSLSASFGSYTPGDSCSAALCGTPLYLAPEVIRGQSACESSDIWAFGLCLLELITGEDPWSERNFNSVEAALFTIGSTTSPPEWDSEDISPELNDVLTQCLALDPGARPSALELLDHVFVHGPLDARLESF